MSEQLIIQATELMAEQAAAYCRLNISCTNLIPALTQGSPESLSSLVRATETELLAMRSRLLKLMSALTSFADSRANSPEQLPLSVVVRESFSKASDELQSNASRFQQTCTRASALAGNGAIFASASIEMFGILPSTYRAPYARRGDGKTWA